MKSSEIIANKNSYIYHTFCQMVEEEAIYSKNYYDKNIREFGKRKMTYSEAKNNAYELILMWIDIANAETINLESVVDLADFVASRRRPKIWATLIGLA